MPTNRPRHQITETAAVAGAIDMAARRWPDEPRSKLLLRLVDAGRAALERGQDEVARRRPSCHDKLLGPVFPEDLENGRAHAAIRSDP